MEGFSTGCCGAAGWGVTCWTGFTSGTACFTSCWGTSGWTVCCSVSFFGALAREAWVGITCGAASSVFSISVVVLSETGASDILASGVESTNIWSGITVGSAAGMFSGTVSVLFSAGCSTGSSLAPHSSQNNIVSSSIFAPHSSQNLIWSSSVKIYIRIYRRISFRCRQYYHNRDRSL